MQLKIKYEGMILRITCNLNNEAEKIKDIQVWIRLENERDTYKEDKLAGLLTYAANLDIYKLLKAYEEDLKQAQLRFYGKDMTIILGEKQAEIRKGELIKKCSYEYWDNTTRVDFDVEIEDGKPFQFDEQIPEDVQKELADWDHSTTVITETSEERVFKISLIRHSYLLKDKRTEVEI